MKNIKSSILVLLLIIAFSSVCVNASSTYYNSEKLKALPIITTDTIIDPGSYGYMGGRNHYNQATDILEMDAVTKKAVQDKTDELCSGKTTDREKANAIFQYLITNMEYISVPTTFPSVWKGMTGNCTSFTRVMAAMLTDAGISNGLAHQSGHVLNIALCDGHWIWIDATQTKFDLSDNLHKKVTFVYFPYENCIYRYQFSTSKMILDQVGYDDDTVDENLKEITIPDWVDEVAATCASNYPDITIKGKKNSAADDFVKNNEYTITYSGEQFTAVKKNETHNATAFAEKKSTCTTDGNTAYWYCSDCNKYYSDSECKNEITKDSWVTKALGHSYKTVSAGNGCTYKECTRCHVKTSYTAPSYVKSFKVSKGSKSFTAKWKKQSKTTQKKFTGYRIRYSTKSNMSGAKTVYVKKSASSKKISKLSKKKKYYVEICSYVKKSGKTYYSKSTKKSVTTK